eukprot:g56145.t1
MPVVVWLVSHPWFVFLQRMEYSLSNGSSTTVALCQETGGSFPPLKRQRQHSRDDGKHSQEGHRPRDCLMPRLLNGSQRPHKTRVPSYHPRRRNATCFKALDFGPGTHDISKEQLLLPITNAILDGEFASQDGCFTA